MHWELDQRVYQPEREEAHIRGRGKRVPCADKHPWAEEWTKEAKKRWGIKFIFNVEYTPQHRWQMEYFNNKLIFVL